MTITGIVSHDNGRSVVINSDTAEVSLGFLGCTVGDGGTQDALASLNRCNFIFHLGDFNYSRLNNGLSNAAEVRDFLALFAPYDTPVALVPGNHDHNIHSLPDKASRKALEYLPPPLNLVSARAMSGWFERNVRQGEHQQWQMANSLRELTQRVQLNEHHPEHLPGIDRIHNHAQPFSPQLQIGSAEVNKFSLPPNGYATYEFMHNDALAVLVIALNTDNLAYSDEQQAWLVDVLANQGARAAKIMFVGHAPPVTYSKRMMSNDDGKMYARAAAILARDDVRKRARETSGVFEERRRQAADRVMQQYEMWLTLANGRGNVDIIRAVLKTLIAQVDPELWDKIYGYVSAHEHYFCASKCDDPDFPMTVITAGGGSGKGLGKVKAAKLDTDVGRIAAYHDKTTGAFQMTLTAEVRATGRFAVRTVGGLLTHSTFVIEPTRLMAQVEGDLGFGISAHQRLVQSARGGQHNSVQFSTRAGAQDEFILRSDRTALSFPTIEQKFMEFDASLSKMVAKFNLGPRQAQRFTTFEAACQERGAILIQMSQFVKAMQRMKNSLRTAQLKRTMKPEAIIRIVTISNQTITRINTAIGMQLNRDEITLLEQGECDALQGEIKKAFKSHTETISPVAQVTLLALLSVCFLAALVIVLFTEFIGLRDHDIAEGMPDWSRWLLLGLTAWAGSNRSINTYHNAPESLAHELMEAKRALVKVVNSCTAHDDIREVQQRNSWCLC